MTSTYEEDDFDWADMDRLCSYPCHICGEEDEVG